MILKLLKAPFDLAIAVLLFTMITICFTALMSMLIATAPVWGIIAVVLGWRALK